MDPFFFVLLLLLAAFAPGFLPRRDFPLFLIIFAAAPQIGLRLIMLHLLNAV